MRTFESFDREILRSAQDDSREDWRPIFDRFSRCNYFDVGGWIA